MTPGERIKHLREALRMTQEELSIKMGYKTKGSINKIEMGTRKIPPDKIQDFAKALGTTPEYIMGWEESSNIERLFDNIKPISTQMLPVLGSVACGEPIYADDNIEFYVEVTTKIKADFVLIARGDSMINARIQDGDLVFCKATSMVENGQIGVVIIDDEATLKRVYFDKEKGVLTLQAENPKYMPMVYIGEQLDDIRIIGKAVAFQSDIN
jgi:repressor LexA